MKPAAVIFDLDGVNTDTAHLHFLAWRSIAAEIDIDIDEAFNETLKGISRMASLDRILAYGNKATRFSAAEKAALAAKKNDRYVDSLASLTPQAILPGIRPLLNALRRERVPVGLASVSLNAPAILQVLELTSCFDFCADASRIRHSKPDPEIFIAACAGLGVAPSQAIGIEDSQAGISAINACRMLSVGIGEGLNNAGLLLASTRDLTWARLSNYWLSAHAPAA